MIRGASFLPLLFTSVALSDVILSDESARSYAQFVDSEFAKRSHGTLLLDARADRAAKLARLKSGELVVEKVASTAKIPDASVHHFIATTFVPGRTAQDVYRITSDFARYAEFFHPSVTQSRPTGNSGGADRMFLQVFIKKATSVTLNTEHAVKTRRLDAGTLVVRSTSTRIAEVDGASEKPPGSDRGFLWKQDSQWTFVERDAGVYLQVEWISLARDNWLMRPFIAAGHREFLELLVRNSRAESLKAPTQAKAASGAR